MANQNKPKQAANPVRSAANNLKPTGQPANPANLTPKVVPAGGPVAPRKLTPKQEAARRRAQKRRRVQLLITGVIVLVIAAALIALGISISQPTVFNNIPAAASVDERPFELGPADAKVVVEEYGDYQCPFCKQWHQDTQPQFINDYIKSGKSVKFVFKPFPFLDANSTTRESHVTTEAAYCAADQKRFWDFDNALYDNQPQSENSGYWTANRLKALAKALQLDTNQFNSCMDSNKYRSKATTDATDAQNRGVTGTPTFYVNGTAVQAQDYASLKTAIDAALSK
jgi:protein-disulfide isomerase